MNAYKIFEKNHIDHVVGATPQYVRSVKYTSPLHLHDYYEFFMITSGSCIHNINGEKQLLLEGSIVFIRPEDSHSYELNGERDCEFINIAYSRSITESAFGFIDNRLCREMLLDPKLPLCVVLLPADKENLIERYYDLTAAVSINKASAGVQFKGLLIDVITRYLLNDRNPVNNSMPIWFSSLIRQMQKKDNYRSGLHKAYELSGRSVGHLNRCFKQYLNTTPTDYINRIRLNYARNLIMSTDLSVLEISLESGFQNLSHFNHLFKAQFSQSPHTFRTGK